MWHVFTDKVTPYLVLAAAMLAAGCGSVPAFIEGSGAWNFPGDAGPSTRVQREYRAALQAMEEGREKVAIQHLEAFVANNPEWPGAYVNLAILYDRAERSDEALNLLNHAITEHPDFVPALNQLGVMRRKQGDFEAAEQAWLSATRINPEYAYAWYNLGVLYELYLQDLQAALDHFRRYQELVGQSGGDPRVAGWISDLERRIGKPGQAAAAREVK